MKPKSVINLLKTVFVVLVLICLMQLIFTYMHAKGTLGTFTFTTSLFALQIPFEITNELLGRSLSLYILVCALPFYTLCFFVIIKLIGLLKPLTDGSSPFSASSVKRIRQIGFACWIYAAVKMIAESAGGYVLLRSAFAKLLWDVSVNLPVNELITGAVVLALAEVFAHGVALKQDNDSIV